MYTLLIVWRYMTTPDNETFTANVTSTYGIIEVACKLGMDSITVASSEMIYGVCFAQVDVDYHSFPFEEDYDVDPADSYALSKVLCREACSNDKWLIRNCQVSVTDERQFARRYKGIGI
jgi:nucleoside-diphosphate-sugar epimerase